MQWKKLLFKTIKAQKKHKKAKVTRYSARDLKNIYIGRGPWVQEGVLLELHCPLKVATTLLNGSRRVAVGALVVTYLSLVLRQHGNTSGPYIYWRKQANQPAHLELCHTNPDILEMILKRRDSGQSRILGGNWHFRWGWFFFRWDLKTPCIKNNEYESQAKKWFRL